MNSLLALSSCATLASAVLPVPTISEVCPALSFNHDHKEVGNSLKVAWMPEKDAMFDFVDLHIVSTSGEQKNIPMTRVSMDKPFIAAVPLDAAWDKYSFSYCTPINGKPVDCDTEHFPLITFAWRAGLASCPEECGLPAQVLEVPVSCIGSDGNIYSDENCANLSRPMPLHCPATASCVTYYWEALPVACPTQCGMPSMLQEPITICMGTDGREHSGRCVNLPRPRPTSCPATTDCVSYGWRAGLAECPTQCGQQASTLERPLDCMGSDGRVYPDEMCAGQQMPPPLHCAATPACVSHYWEVEPVYCPTECGLEASTLEKPLNCMGTDGRAHPYEMCAGQQMPSPLHCAATPACVSHYWEAEPVFCPTECGLEATMMERSVFCMGTDGQQYPGHMCAGLVKPPATQCPSTAPCVTYYWKADPVLCPTTCGMPVTTLEPLARCVGTDGQTAAHEMCAGLAYPEAQQCPATSPCQWVQGSMQCSTECGLKEQKVEAALSCVNESGQDVAFSKCSLVDMPQPLFCPATQPCTQVVTKVEKVMVPVPQPQIIQAQPAPVAVAMVPTCGSEGNPCFVQAGMVTLERTLPARQQVFMQKVGKVGKVGKFGKGRGGFGKRRGGFGKGAVGGGYNSGGFGGFSSGGYGGYGVGGFGY